MKTSKKTNHSQQLIRNVRKKEKINLTDSSPADKNIQEECKCKYTTEMLCKGKFLCLNCGKPKPTQSNKNGRFEDTNIQEDSVGTICNKYLVRGYKQGRIDCLAKIKKMLIKRKEDIKTFLITRNEKATRISELENIEQKVKEIKC